MKNILYIFILALFSTTVTQGQSVNFGKLGAGPVSHAQWKLSSKKISDCEYDLIFTVTLEKGWHTFSVVKLKGVGLAVFPTQIIFAPGKDYSLVGNLTETKPTPEYDATIKTTVLLHYNKAIFTQRVKLNSSAKVKISGKYEYQVCKDACEQPPYETFDFELQGAATCKK